MIKLKKRLPILLMTAVIIPGFIIGILGIYLVSQQKNARLLNVKNEYTDRLLRICTNTEIRIRQLIENTFQQIEISNMNYSRPESLPSHIKNIVLNNPIVKYPFFINSRHTFLFPFSKKTALPAAPSPAVDVDGIILKKRVREFYEKGYNLEYRQRKYIEAVKCYLKSLQEDPGDHGLPYIYFSIARCYFKLNQFPQAVNYYYKVLYQFQDLRGREKFLYFTILRQLAVSYKQIDSPGNAVKFYLRLYEEILNDETSGNSDTPALEFYKNEALDYLNRHARKNSKQTEDVSLNRSRAIDRLKKESELDISLKWLYFDMEGGEETGPIDKDAEEFKFLKLRELYEANDEKTQFYKAIKNMKEWSMPVVTSAGAEIKPLKYPAVRRSGTFEIAFKPIIVDHAELDTIFFGCMVSFDFIKNEIIQPIAQRELNDPAVFINISGSNNSRLPLSLVSVPFRTLLAGKILMLHSYRDDYFESIVQRDISLYYLLLFALILTLISGIIIFYKYLSREAELVRLKAEFVDSASHTLKTPLTRISLLAENVKQGWVTGESRKEEFFDRIILETARMNDMIDNMLNFSRIEAGKQQYEPDKIYLQEIAASMIDRYSTHIRKSGFDLVVEIEDHLPALKLDPKALRLIIGNLLQNAVKYSLKEKYIKIRVSREKEFVVLEIEDKGIGIPKNELPHIFKKFTRVSDNRVKTIEGSGLGLFLVRHAVDAHNGKIKVKSSVDRGTVFTIQFPLTADLHGQ